jgi:hypothetical protein
MLSATLLQAFQNRSDYSVGAGTRTVPAMHFDEFSLAAAIIRDARVGNGEAALDLAADLLQRLGAPVGPTTDFAAAQGALDSHSAGSGTEP